MRLLLWVIVLFIIAIFISIGVREFSANLFFSYGDNLYEINLATFILFLLTSLLLLYILFKVIAYIFSIPNKAKLQYLKINFNLLNKNLVKAGIAYFEGEYSKSISIIKNSILKNNAISSIKPLALIIGANSANKINNIEDRDFFLNQLEDNNKDYKIYKNILIADSSIINNDYVTAKDNIDQIKNISSNLRKVLLLELKISEIESNNDSVIKLSNTLYKDKVFSKKELDNYQVNSYRNLILVSDNIKNFKSLLKKIPDEYKENQLVVDIAKKYKELGLFDDELKWALKYYPKVFNIELLNLLLSNFLYFDDKQQLYIMKETENWLLKYPKDDKLLLFLGQITYLQKLWGKSQSYLEASFNINDDIHTGLILAKVLDERGKTKEAKKIYDRFLNEIKQEERKI